MIRDNDRGRCPKVRKPCRELFGAPRKVLPKDMRRRAFWKIRNGIKWMEMSHPIF